MSRGKGYFARFRQIKGDTGRGVLPKALYLPVLIGEFSLDETYSHVDFDTIGGGEFSVPQVKDPSARSLRETSIETLTVDWHRSAPWLANRDSSPAQVRQALLKIARSKTPVQLRVAESNSGVFEAEMNVTIRSLTQTSKPGEADTRYYQIGIKEWRRRGVNRRTSSTALKLPTTTKITKETTLESLARHYYKGRIPLSLGAAAIAHANGLTRWGTRNAISKAKGWKTGKQIKIPREPTAVDPPRPEMDPFTGLNR